ncbi:hypothetical protein BTVI_81209 [Pitangus sulphuratus]|nr:hypothetical protein BTVI_81209 [Pitangus sulphuratus]
MLPREVITAPSLSELKNDLDNSLSSRLEHAKEQEVSQKFQEIYVDERSSKSISDKKGYLQKVEELTKGVGNLGGLQRHDLSVMIGKAKAQLELDLAGDIKGECM